MDLRIWLFTIFCCLHPVCGQYRIFSIDAPSKWRLREFSGRAAPYEVNVPLNKLPNDERINELLRKTWLG
ncbi:unnamed protein product, partial [Mesorhabditis spiculigera]